jgi:hypothetical protein
MGEGGMRNRNPAHCRRAIPAGAPPGGTGRPTIRVKRRAGKPALSFFSAGRLNPHFSYPFYCGWSFPVLAALRLLAPRAVCSHTALSHSRRAPCQAGKFLRLVTKGMRNAG